MSNRSEINGPAIVQELGAILMGIRNGSVSATDAEAAAKVADSISKIKMQECARMKIILDCGDRGRDFGQVLETCRKELSTSDSKARLSAIGDDEEEVIAA